MPELIEFFNDINIHITSSPVLDRYNPNKPNFLKTDWSVEGMGLILMQPAINPTSIDATDLLLNTVTCVFDTTKSSAQLHAILFGFRCCTGLEMQYYSFVGNQHVDVEQSKK